MKTPFLFSPQSQHPRCRGYLFLFPTPHTPHPTPQLLPNAQCPITHTRHPTPDTPHPTPHTPHPTP
ncbi:MAG: hypothetical protein F6J93_32555 [Oscillatoria sp. SIO1A7]|nr:hypothetical protein [Oscillatoria sp. SIO1A7]